MLWIRINVATHYLEKVSFAFFLKYILRNAGVILMGSAKKLHDSFLTSQSICVTV